MADYQPSLEDVQSSVPIQTGGYQPSLEDVNVPSTPINNVPPNDMQSKEQLIDSLMGKGQTPFGNIRDFLYGGGSAMAHLAGLVNPSAPPMPDIRQANPNPMAEGMGRYLPYALAGGGSLLGSTLGSGAFGATQFDKGQNGLIDSSLGLSPGGRARSSFEDMMLNALSHGLVSSFIPKDIPKTINFKQNAYFAPGESQFTNIPYSQPSFLNQDSPKPLSPSISAALHQNIGLGKSLEDTGKNLASTLQDTYDQVKGAHKVRYDNIFNSPTDEVSIFDEKPILVKDKYMSSSQYANNYRNKDIPDKNIEMLHDNFMDSPSIQTAHYLQSELGDEIGYLQNQQTKGNLDQIGKNKLNDYVNRRNLLLGDMRSQLNDINPALKNDFDQVTQDWKNNVEPWHVDKDLKAIAQGKIKNPMSSQINSIFKNPEPSMDKVVSYLPDSAKDNIAYIGMGKHPYQNTPQDILNGMKSLDNKGLSSYLRPEHQQYYANLRNNISMENEAQARSIQNQKLMDQMKAARDQVEQARIRDTQNSIANMNKEQNESNSLIQGKNQEFKENANKLAQLNYQKKLSRANALRSIVGGGLGAALVTGLNIPENSVFGSYIGKDVLKKIKK